MYLQEWTQSVKTHTLYVNGHWRGPTMEDRLHSQVDIMVWLVDISQSLSLTTCADPMGARIKWPCGIGGGYTYCMVAGIGLTEWALIHQG